MEKYIEDTTLTRDFCKGQSAKLFKKVKDMALLEVSPCTFPAYPQTEIAARQRSYDNYKKEMLKNKKQLLKERLKNAK